MQEPKVPEEEMETYVPWPHQTFQDLLSLWSRLQHCSLAKETTEDGQRGVVKVLCSSQQGFSRKPRTEKHSFLCPKGLGSSSFHWSGLALLALKQTLGLLPKSPSSH